MLADLQHGILFQLYHICSTNRMLIVKHGVKLEYTSGPKYIGHAYSTHTHIL